MHIQLPLAIESEKEAVLRELITLLSSFSVDFLEGLFEELNQPRCALHRVVFLRIHVAEPEEESAC